MMSSPFRCPIRQTNPYAPPKHWGEDYVPTDKKKAANWYLFAPADGEVIVSKKQHGDYAGGYGAFGNYLVIKCKGNVWILMAHLKELPVVKVGDKVKQGQFVGIAGNTGNSTGRHLHIEVSNNPASWDSWWDRFRDAVARPSVFIDFEDYEEACFMKWKNGSTRENVYSTVDDCNLKEHKIGSLDPYEEAECYAKIDGVYLVVYHTSTTRKTGFVKYSGGVKW